MRRWLYAVTVFLFIVLTLSACGGGPQNSTDNIVVWHWLTDREQAFLELANRYKAETGITVSFELYAPSDAYTQKVRASAQTETLPDIYGLLAEKRDFASFIKAGHVADLSADMEKDNGAWQNSLFEKALDVNRFLSGNQWDVNPGVYGVPVDVSNIQMLYNKDLFKKAGLDPERPPKTWAEFLEAGTALKAAGISGLVSGWGEVWMIDCFLSNYAMNIMGMDKYIATLRGEVPYTDPDWLKALGIFKEMVDSGILAPGIVVMVNKSAEQTFANNRAAFAFNGSWCVNVYKGMNPNLNYGVMLPPKISADNPMYIWGGAGTSFMVNEKSANKEKAIAFLRWLTQKEQQSFLAKETNNLPSNKKSLADIAPILAQFADGMANVTHPNVLPVNEYSQVIEFLTKGAQSIIIGEKTPEQVAKEVQEIKKKKMAYEKAKKEREKAQ